MAVILIFLITYEAEHLSFHVFTGQLSFFLYELPFILLYYLVFNNALRGWLKINLISKYLLSTFYMSIIVLDVEYIMVNKIVHCPCPNGAYKVIFFPFSAFFPFQR